jgi:hypothetical protein
MAHLRGHVGISQFPSRGADVSEVSKLTEGPLLGGRGQVLGTTRVFEFSFTTRADQVDFAHSGINNPEGSETKGKSQLLMAVRVRVPPGEEEVQIKPVSELACFDHRGGRRGQSPGDVCPQSTRIAVQPGEVKVAGDTRLFAFAPPLVDPFDRVRDRAAYWDPRAAVADWTAKMRSCADPGYTPIVDAPGSAPSVRDRAGIIDQAKSS